MQMVGWMAYPSTQPLSSLRKYCWPLPVIFVVTRSSVPWWVFTTVTDVAKMPRSTHFCMGYVERLKM